VRGEVFRTIPPRHCDPPNFLYNAYWVSSRCKRLGRGVDHPTSSSPEVKERVELYLYSPFWPSWSVLGSTLHTLSFLFTIGRRWLFRQILIPVTKIQKIYHHVLWKFFRLFGSSYIYVRKQRCIAFLTKSSLIRKHLGKGKAVPLQAWSGPEGCRKLRFPDFMTTAHRMVVGCQPYAPAAFTPRKYSWYSFLLGGWVGPWAKVLSEGFYVNEKSTDTSWVRSSDLPICSTAP